MGRGVAPSRPDMPTDTRRLADRLLWFENRPQVWGSLDRVARRHAEHARPDAVAALATAESAAQAASTASRTYRDRLTYYDQTLSHYGTLAHTEDPNRQLHQLERDIAGTVAGLATAQRRIAQLAAEPAITAQPVGRFTHERDSWRIRRDARSEAINAPANRVTDRGEDARQRMRETEHTLHHTSGHKHGPNISR